MITTVRGAMTEDEPKTPTMLRALLITRHQQEHKAFCRAYAKAAKQVDPTLADRPPSKPTFYRWLGGTMKGLPHPDHCQVLQAMFPNCTVQEMLQPWEPGRPLPEHAQSAQAARLAGATSYSYADLIAAYATRAEFAEQMPPHTLFDSASHVRAAGLSLNILCQNYSDQRLRTLLGRGAKIQALFLDPDGEAIKSREIEEDQRSGTLVNLTRINMDQLARLRNELDAEHQDQVEIRTYDQTLRFNITIIDNRQLVAQPYLPAIRGVDSPTLVLRRRTDGVGMFPTFERVFDSLWTAGRTVA